jgi:membrane protease YdiL (CAAX protease family)
VNDGAPPLIRRVRWYHPLLAGFASVLMLGLAAIAVLVWHVVRFGAPLSPYTLAALFRDFDIGCLVTGAQEAGMLGVSLWFLSRITDPALPARFTKPTARLLLRGAGIAVALMLGIGLFTFLCDTFLHTHLGDDGLPFHPTSLVQLPQALLAIAVLAPLAEEAFFRGLVMGWLARHWGRWAALIGQALLFGLVHGKFWMPGGLDGWLLTGALAAMGFVLGLCAWRSGNLWTSVAIHAVNNGCAVLALFFLPDR